MLIPAFLSKTLLVAEFRTRPPPLAICARACLHSGPVKTFGYPRQRRLYGGWRPRRSKCRAEKFVPLASRILHEVLRCQANPWRRGVEPGGQIWPYAVSPV